MALLLGFRLQLQAPATMADTQAEGGGEWALRQDPLLAPLRWANLTSVPVLGSVGDTALQERLAADLPEDDSSTGNAVHAVHFLLYAHKSWLIDWN